MKNEKRITAKLRKMQRNKTFFQFSNGNNYNKKYIAREQREKAYRLVSIDSCQSELNDQQLTIAYENIAYERVYYCI